MLDQDHFRLVLFNVADLGSFAPHTHMSHPSSKSHPAPVYPPSPHTPPKDMQIDTPC